MNSSRWLFWTASAAVALLGILLWGQGGRERAALGWKEALAEGQVIRLKESKSLPVLQVSEKTKASPADELVIPPRPENLPPPEFSTRLDRR